MPAHDENHLEEKLTQHGMWLVDSKMELPGLETEAPKKEIRFFRARPGKHRRELIDFCTLMTFQIKVGIPLVRALEVAWQDCKDPGFQQVVRGLQSHIENG